MASMDTLREAVAVLQIRPPQRTSVDLQRLANFLRKQPFFAGVDFSTLLQICTVLTLQRAALGDVVLSAGEITDRLFLLLGGRCSVCRHSCREGFQPPAAQPLEPGQALCEAALVVPGRPSDVTVTVTAAAGEGREGGGEEGEGAVLAVLTRAAWSDMCARAPIQPECSEARLALLSCCCRSLAATEPAQRTLEQAEDLAALLRLMPGLSRTPPHVLRVMSESASLAALPPGTVLFEEHSRGVSQFLVLSGAVEMHVRPKRKGAANRAALRSALKSAVAAGRARSAVGRSRGGGARAGGGAGGQQKTVRQKIEEERRAREEIRQALVLQREGLRTPPPQPPQRRASKAKDVGEGFKRWMVEFLDKKRGLVGDVDGLYPSLNDAFGAAPSKPLPSYRGAFGGRVAEKKPGTPSKAVNAWRRAAYKALHTGAAGEGGGGGGWLWEGDGGGAPDMTLLEYERRKHEEAGGMKDVGYLFGGAAARKAHMRGMASDGGGYAEELQEHGTPRTREGTVHWAAADEVAEGGGGGGGGRASGGGGAGSEQHGLDLLHDGDVEVEEEDEEADPWVRLTYLDRKYRVVRKAIRYMTAVEKVLGIATSSTNGNGANQADISAARHDQTGERQAYCGANAPPAGGNAEADADGDPEDGDADAEDPDDPRVAEQIQLLLLAGNDGEAEGGGVADGGVATAAAAAGRDDTAATDEAAIDNMQSCSRTVDGDASQAAVAAAAACAATGDSHTRPGSQASQAASVALNASHPASGIAPESSSATLASAPAGATVTPTLLTPGSAATGLPPLAPSTATTAANPEVFEACDEHLEQLYGSVTGGVEAGQVAGELPDAMVARGAATVTTNGAVLGSNKGAQRHRRAYSAIAGPAGADVLVIALEALRRGHDAARDDMISERLTALTALEPLRALSDEHQAQLALGCKLLCLDANQLIVRQGQQVDAMYVVMDGEVRLLDDPDGQATAASPLPQPPPPTPLQPLAPPGPTTAAVSEAPPRMSACGVSAAASAGGAAATSGGSAGGGGAPMSLKARRTVASLAALSLLGPGGSFGESVLGYPEDVAAATAVGAQGRRSTSEGSEPSFPPSYYLASAVASRACKLLVVSRSLLARFTYLRASLPPFAALRREAVRGRRQQLKASLLQGRSATSTLGPGNTQVAALRIAELLPPHQLPVLLLATPMPQGNSGGGGSNGGSSGIGSSGGGSGGSGGGAAGWMSPRPPPLRPPEAYESQSSFKPVLRRVFNGLAKPLTLGASASGSSPSGGGGAASPSASNPILSPNGGAVSPNGGAASGGNNSPSCISPGAPSAPSPPPPPAPLMTMQERRRRQDLLAASAFAPNAPYSLNNALFRARAEDAGLISALGSPKPVAPHAALRNGSVPHFRSAASSDGTALSLALPLSLPLSALASPTLAGMGGIGSPRPMPRMRASASGAIGGGEGGVGGVGGGAAGQHSGVEGGMGCAPGVGLLSLAGPLSPARCSLPGGGGGGGGVAGGSPTVVGQSTAVQPTGLYGPGAPRGTWHPAPGLLPKLGSPASAEATAGAVGAASPNAGSAGAAQGTAVASKPLLRTARRSESFLLRLDTSSAGSGSGFGPGGGADVGSPTQYGGLRGGRMSAGRTSGTGALQGAGGGGGGGMLSPVLLTPLRPVGQQPARA